MTNDLISRQMAIDAISLFFDKAYIEDADVHKNDALYELNLVPSAQPEQTKMIKEIRKWINSGNRGNADYFIVDKIEEIINKYE